MLPVFKQMRCPVQECGAVVFLAEVDGARITLNPARVDVAVPDADGRMKLVRGYMLHGTTCVDISARLNRAQIAARR